MNIIGLLFCRWHALSTFCAWAVNYKLACQLVVTYYISFNIIACALSFGKPVPMTCIVCTTLNNSSFCYFHKSEKCTFHDDVIKWTNFPCYWPLVRGIHRPLVNYVHKGQRRGALMFSFICPRINGWVNDRAAADLRHHRAHYDVIVMLGNTDTQM